MTYAKCAPSDNEAKNCWQFERRSQRTRSDCFNIEYSQEFVTSWHPARHTQSIVVDSSPAMSRTSHRQCCATLARIWSCPEAWC